MQTSNAGYEIASLYFLSERRPGEQQAAGNQPEVFSDRRPVLRSQHKSPMLRAQKYGLISPEIKE